MTWSQGDKNKSMHYSSLRGTFLNSPSISTRQHIEIIKCCLSLTTTVTSMRKPDSSLKQEPVARKQIVLFHGVLGTARAWTRPAAYCVTCHCNWQPDHKLQLGPLGLFHFSVPPPLFHLPHWRTPLSFSTLSWKNHKNPGPRVRDFLCKCWSGSSCCFLRYLLLLISQGPSKHMLGKCVPTGRVLYSTKITSFLGQRFSIRENYPTWELLGPVGAL